jgi:phosphoribosylformylglycinamidine synthase
MKFGIIVFPGTTCERDTYNWITKGGYEAMYISHKENTLPEHVDMLILPGGFAFGDRVYQTATGSFIFDPGKKALSTPVMEIIYNAVDRIPILGICNGFQILTHAGLLPGRLERNTTGTFHCNHMKCFLQVDSPLAKLPGACILVDIPVAHGYGRYVIDEEDYVDLEANDQDFLVYDENINGSMYDIAGVSNKQKTVWGMMPHPERSPYSDLFLNNIVEYTNENF